MNGSGCEPGYKSIGTAAASQMVLVQKVSALVVDDCTEENADISRLAKFWNVPVMLRSGNGLKLSDAQLYPYTVQFDDTTSVAVAMAITELATNVNERKLLFVGPKATNPKNPPIFSCVATYIKDSMPWIDVTGVVEANEQDWGDATQKLRTETKCKFLSLFKTNQLFSDNNR